MQCRTVDATKEVTTALTLTLMVVVTLVSMVSASTKDLASLASDLRMVTFVEGTLDLAVGVDSLVAFSSSLCLPSYNEESIKYNHHIY